MWTRGGGELEDGAIWVGSEPDVEYGSILGWEVREAVVWADFHRRNVSGI